MKYPTNRFGEIEVDEKDVITIPAGPLGFPGCTRFALVDPKLKNPEISLDNSIPFQAMQSLDNPALAFIVLDVYFARPDYQFPLTSSDLIEIEANHSGENIQLIGICTMARDIKDATINLQGPLVINLENRIGHQYILVDTDYTTREPILTRNPVPEAGEQEMENGDVDIDENPFILLQARFFSHPD